MSPGEHCDEILRLIDEVLDDPQFRVVDDPIVPAFLLRKADTTLLPSPAA